MTDRAETMVEVVARAMQASDDAQPMEACACLGKASPDDWACPCKKRWQLTRARAAIAAMREPTEAMLRAGGFAVMDYGSVDYEHSDVGGAEIYADAHRAAIDAALTDGETK